MRQGLQVLTINPGSTSTKIALFRDDEMVFVNVLRHDTKTLAMYETVGDQYPMRLSAVMAALGGKGVVMDDLDAVVGRGGILRPIPGGTYLVGETMLSELCSQHERDHASNLGARLAHEIAKPLSVPAYVVDPVCIDEFDPLARVAGLPEIERRSLSHALNLKATARRAAADMGWTYSQLRLVVVHMGGGITVSAHREGRMIDVNQAYDGTGPFSPERSGGLPVGDVLRMAYSVPPYDQAQRTYHEMMQKIAGQGGLVAHLGTNDAREVERRILAGDAHARLVYEAMAYQIAKETGGMVTVLRGDVDAIVLTGGLAHSTMLVGWLEERLQMLAPILVYPGQDEMRAMAEGALRVLRGHETARVYE